MHGYIKMFCACVRACGRVFMFMLGAVDLIAVRTWLGAGGNTNMSKTHWMGTATTPLRRLLAHLWTAAIILGMHMHMQRHIRSTEASLNNIGICYGMMGDNLPAASDAIGLYQKYGIGSLRLYEPNPSALEALRGKQIGVSLGVRNEDIQNIASSQEAANSWFSNSVAPYLNDIVFAYISVGNEAIPGDSAAFVAPAMQNLQNILSAQNLAGISLTTVVAQLTLATSFPPSAGAFSDEALASLGLVLQFLSAQGSPLLVNVYPYFAYASDPVNVRLDYAQFTAPGPVIQDGDLSYSNLLDAALDAFYAAMERAGFSNLDLVVSESGWPSAGNGNFTTPALAATYNKNFVQHVVTSGTPKRPQAHLEGYIFAMFNENLKPAGVEQNFGLFYPNMEPVYPVFPPTSV